MKKLSFLFVAFALVGFISLNACKSTTPPAEEPAEEVVEEVEMVEEVPDSVVAVDEDVVEEVAE